MEIAMIGLGRMGANMAQRLMRGGHKVVGYDPADAARALLEKSGAETAASLEEVATMTKCNAQAASNAKVVSATARTIADAGAGQAAGAESLGELLQLFEVGARQALGAGEKTKNLESDSCGFLSL